MFSKSLRCSIALRCSVALILIFGVTSCGDQDQKKPATGTKHQKPINCDTDINVDVNNGPSPDPVYLCTGDTLTWHPAADTTFQVDFGSAGPFSDNATKFDDKHASHPGQMQYPQLYVYKYSITVTKTKPVVITKTFDPQVVTGGNQ